MVRVVHKVQGTASTDRGRNVGAVRCPVQDAVVAHRRMVLDVIVEIPPAD